MKRIIILLALCMGICSSPLFAQTYPPLYGGTVAPNSATIYKGHRLPPITDVVRPSGGTGYHNYVYEWVSTPYNNNTPGGPGSPLGWPVVSSGLSYQPPALYESTSYMRKVTDRGFNPARVSFSNMVNITVIDFLGGTISPENQVIAKGDMPSLLNNVKEASKEMGAPQYTWQQSVNGETWFTASGTTNGPTYQPPRLSQTTYFRRKAVFGSSTAYSNTVSISCDGIEFSPVENVVTLDDIDDRTKGLKVYEKVAILYGDIILTTPNYVERSFYYDKKGRVVQTAEKNHVGHTSYYSTKYDFVGNVIASHEKHSVTNERQLVHPVTGEELEGGAFMIRAMNTPPYWNPATIDPEGKYLSATGIKPEYIITTLWPGQSYQITFYYIPKGCLEIAQNFERSVYGDFFIVNEPQPEFEHLLCYDYKYDSKLTEFTYDKRGRLLSETTTINDSKPATIDYTYDELGRLEEKRYFMSTDDRAKIIPDDYEPLVYGRYFMVWPDNGNEYLTDSDPECRYLSATGQVHEKYYIGQKTYNATAYNGYQFSRTDYYYYIPKDCLDIAEFAEMGDHTTFAIVNQLPAGVADGPLLTHLGTAPYYDSQPLLTETYDYNIQGWLTEQSNEVFDMKLKYFDPVYTLQRSFTGNIMEWEWTHMDPEMPLRFNAINTNTYTFSYDRLGRLTGSQLSNIFTTPGTTPFSEQNISYDKNGNILTMKRYGQDGLNSGDNLQYGYTGNRLTSLTRWSLNPVYYPPPQPISISEPYTYDKNGNMTYDGENRLRFEYNLLNLPDYVLELGSYPYPMTGYRWLADGTKVEAVASMYDGANYIDIEKQYLGSLIYTSDYWMAPLELESVAFGGGRFTVSETDDGNGGTKKVYTPNFFITDHLGSTRVVIRPTEDESPTDPDQPLFTVLERNDFYPFGKRWETPSAAITDNRFRFSGKEEQDLFNLPYIDFGARMYDPFIGRWTTPDPLAEKYLKWSPYNYTLNNPIRYIDPFGLDVWIHHTTENGENGKTLYTAGMSYDGSDGFVRDMIDILNEIYNSGGRDMLNALIGSTNAFNIKNQVPSIAGAGGTFKRDMAGGGTLNAGRISGGVSFNNIEVMAHELFHGVQHEFGQGGKSVFNEVEAYVFGFGVADRYGKATGNYGGPMAPLGVGETAESDAWEGAFKSLHEGGYSGEAMRDAINNFHRGAQVNAFGDYNNYPGLPVLPGGARPKSMLSRFWIP